MTHTKDSKRKPAISPQLNGLLQSVSSLGAIIGVPLAPWIRQKLGWCWSIMRGSITIVISAESLPPFLPTPLVTIAQWLIIIYLLFASASRKLSGLLDCLKGTKPAPRKPKQDPPNVHSSEAASSHQCCGTQFDSQVSSDSDILRHCVCEEHPTLPLSSRWVHSKVSWIFGLTNISRSRSTNITERPTNEYLIPL